MARLAPIGHEDQLTLVDHLDELRSRLIASLIVVAIAFGVAFWQSERVLGVLTKPVDTALSTNTSPTAEANDADAVEYAFRVEVTEALKTLRADDADIATALDRLAATETAAADDELAATLRALSDRMGERGEALAQLDLTPPGIDRRPLTLGVTEPFLTTFSSAFYAALLLSLPFLLYQAYAFIVPAFTPRERRVATPLMVMVPFLFLAGVAFAYFLVLPQATRFLLNFNEGEFDIQVGGREAIRFTTQMLIAVGLMFQLPVGILAVQRSGVVTLQQLRSFRRYALVLFLIIAAVVTPTPDPGTMLIATAPLVLLYEVSILVAAWLDRMRPAEPEPEDPLRRLAADYAPLSRDDDD